MRYHNPYPLNFLPSVSLWRIALALTALAFVVVLSGYNAL